MMFYEWLKKQPWLLPIGALLCGLGNAYEAIYVRPDSFMGIIDGVFAIACMLAFFGLSLNAISDYLSKPDE